ncbi:MAG: hypothetical protein PHE29_14295 [Tissierellia bacterium]|nr:hypothetical protein [Tissierellia bacterium]
MLNLKLNPETIIMLPFAVFIDGIGIILICFGLDDMGITDIIGIIFINGQLFFRGEKRVDIKSVKKRAKNIMTFIKKLFTQKPFKFFTSAVLEMIPYLGSLLPFWTIAVLLNLTNEEE